MDRFDGAAPDHEQQPDELIAEARKARLESDGKTFSPTDAAALRERPITPDSRLPAVGTLSGA